MKKWHEKMGIASNFIPKVILRVKTILVLYSLKTKI